MFSAQSMSALSKTLLVLSVGRVVQESISRPTVLDRIGLLNARIGPKKDHTCTSLKGQCHDKDILLKGFPNKLLLLVRELMIFKMFCCIVVEKKVVFSGCLLL
jgi:hypothetical protein